MRWVPGRGFVLAIPSGWRETADQGGSAGLTKADGSDVGLGCSEVPPALNILAPVDRLSARGSHFFGTSFNTRPCGLSVTT